MTLTVQKNVSLRPYNTLGLEAKVAEFVELNVIGDCAELPDLCKGKQVVVLGGGSNVVLAGDIDGLVILNRLHGIECLAQNEGFSLVRVAGGENWDGLVDYALAQGWYGLENLSAIPGTVGAAPVQNIGAYGVELKDCLESVEILDLIDGQSRLLSNVECQFGYRDSIFKGDLKDRCIITHVTFRLQRRPQLLLDYGEIRGALQTDGLDPATLTARQLRDIIIRIRASKLPDPQRLPNVGSFFKNPVIPRAQFALLQQRWPDMVSYPVGENQVKLAAGWLLDRLGWKGRTLGHAAVHDRQALVLLNHGKDPADLLQLKDAILADVREQIGIELEVEPRILGSLA
ncbi:MAG: UDP-N-acetylmuramate dehydrogenase [Gammaproteobacteria bacterium]